MQMEGEVLIPTGKPKNPICFIHKVITNLARSFYVGKAKVIHATSPPCQLISALQAENDLPKPSQHKSSGSYHHFTVVIRSETFFPVLADILGLAEETGSCLEWTRLSGRKPSIESAELVS